MTDEDWSNDHLRAIAIYLSGHGIPDRNELGERVVDDSFLLLINSSHQSSTFTLPARSFGPTWELVIDTADPLLASSRRRHHSAGARQRVPARTMHVLQCHNR
jgi:glycogen operon protein